MKSVSSGGSQILGGLRLAQSLPPHPSPLPWGEGELFPGLRSIERAILTQRSAAVLPLPKGEGWGEGEGDFESTVSCESAGISASVSLLQFSRGLMHRSAIVRQRVRRTLLKRGPDCIANRLLLAAKMRIPIPHDFHAACLQPGVAFRVFLPRLGETVLKSVQFDIELRLKAEKIEHVRAERMLASKFIFGKSSITEPTPNELFRPRVMFPHHSCDTSQFGRGHKGRVGQAGVKAKKISWRGFRLFSGLTLAQFLSPHPSPLPQGEGELSAAHSKSGPSLHCRSLEMVHPLPKGEGWGEGEVGIGTRVTPGCAGGLWEQ